ncbi:monosaccharide ABC transporter ATP-binding protein (CUT2 family) [Sediminihabitans luteus]|uniref:Monosaccharide ABC transporter ATP-binding protein (CUT2 family) n=1 Tax=Sediminihabitans luteus TaxID=1138585 RepID=A0A2M9CYW2_9CELL|nr:multiple monosaccharide ABC transporter ATP-binding protein [Sediminihabitans luteus]PJJ77132.1 monosaccharide ABC transporter ATP-binding protein (CUT2 family) [Sediminihabitans luteus]GII98580.1 xylose ABC transporter ATP-binding protein [Sediminihabitans luteus]
MADGSNILEMRGITKEFPGVKALEDVTLEVRRGEVHAICGENGAGKSTLMKVLSGVYPHGTYDGDILLDGGTVEFRGIKDSEARGVVIIHQELALVPHLSIAENIFLGNERSTGGVVDWNRTSSEAAALLRKVGLSDSPETRAMDLGVGRQQLVEIAKALSKKVDVLILDEPTAALNDEDSAHLLDLIRQFRAEGMTCIIISHKLNEIEAIADRVTVIRDGRTIETLDLHGAEKVDEDRIIRGMVGRSLDSRFPDHTPTIGEEVLRVEDWTVHHPIDTERVVVDHVDLHVRAGEIIGMAGLMGAGRTEFAMSVFGQSYGSRISGRVFKNGTEIRTRTVSEAIGHGLAYATEDRKRYGLNLIQTIRENISASALGKVARWGVVDDNVEIGVAEKYRKDFRIKAPTIESVVGKLSGGNQQKVVLSKWVYSDPDVLILDEPTRGIDVGAKYEIYGIINALADAGKAVVVISSELPELIGLCDRIYAMNQGRIAGEVDREHATQEELMRHMTMDKEVSAR